MGRPERLGPFGPLIPSSSCSLGSPTLSGPFDSQHATSCFPVQIPFEWEILDEAPRTPGAVRVVDPVCSVMCSPPSAPPLARGTPSPVSPSKSDSNGGVMRWEPERWGSVRVVDPLVLLFLGISRPSDPFRLSTRHSSFPCPNPIRMGD